MARPARDAKGRFKKGRARKGRARSKARRNPARRRTPPRNADGTFRGSRRAPARRAAPRRKRNPPAASYAPNPVAGDLLSRAGGAALAATAITVGKAASRSIPGLLKLPSAGPVGVAIRAGTGFALGVVADYAGFDQLGSALMVGGLCGAVEDLAVGYNVPWVGPALQRAPGMIPATGGTTGIYGPDPSLRLMAPAGMVGRYGPERPALRGVAAMNARSR
jgi:hypothetical protein